MSEITNPHDRFFKELLSQRTNIRDFLKYYLPPEIVAEFDLRKIELLNDDFVDEDLKQHLADLLYRVKLKQGDDAFVIVLFEHKSSPEKFVAFQILRYIVRLWERFESQGVKALPPVYPIVFYHGRQRWNIKRNLRALVSIQNNSPLVKFVPEFEYYLVDLNTIRDEDLQGAPYLRAGLLLLKLIFDQELARRLPDIFQALNSEPEKSLIAHFKTLSRYLSKVKNAVEPAQFHQAVKKVFYDRGEKLMAEFFQEWIDQGVQKGQQIGLQQGLLQGEKQGRKQGLQQGQAQLAIKLLESRIGSLPKLTQSQINKLPTEKIMELGIALLDFKTKKDLQNWMSKNVKAN
jgi:predicted transposase/invertase (TIGR01784 family)